MSALNPSVLDYLNLTLDELTEVVSKNPSLRGMILGYAAEVKLKSIWFSDPQKVMRAIKYDDHDRKKKGDLVITYKGREFIIECKSLQTKMIKKLADGSYTGKTQVDASDRRRIGLPNGSKIATTCLLAGEFDILAVNLFAFENKWRFIFAKNQDLPSNFKGYTKKQRKYLLATLMEVSWPPKPPFVADPFLLLDQML